jgi:hypothetical protein
VIYVTSAGLHNATDIVANSIGQHFKGDHGSEGLVLNSLKSEEKRFVVVVYGLPSIRGGIEVRGTSNSV